MITVRLFSPDIVLARSAAILMPLSCEWTTRLNGVGFARCVFDGGAVKFLLRQTNTWANWWLCVEWDGRVQMLYRAHEWSEREGIVEIAGYDVIDYLRSVIVESYVAKNIDAGLAVGGVIRSYVGAYVPLGAASGTFRSFWVGVSAGRKCGKAISIEASYQPVLDVVQEITDAARANGALVYVAPYYSGRFYTGQPATGVGVVTGASMARVPLGVAAYVEGHTITGDDYTVAYGVGSGSGDQRDVVEWRSPRARRAGVWGWREVVAQGYGVSAAEAAQAAIAESRQRIQPERMIWRADTYLLGRWGLGSRVVVGGESRVVRAVRVRVDERADVAVELE